MSSIVKASLSLFPKAIYKLMQFPRFKPLEENTVGKGINAGYSAKSGKQSQPQVYIVGAGAGDIELLTIKAVNVLKKADVIMVDWLVNPDIYQFFPSKVERIFVGKKCGQHSMKQADICKLMVEKAKQGKTVVRLKGGDPSIFGRLAEETDALAHNNISFNIIPGITAASGCAAYSGIPLTHREYAQSVKFVTAHLKEAEEECNWQQLSKETDTLVFYMGLNRVAKIAENLILNGMKSNMSIAVIDQGTSADQKVVCSELGLIKPEIDLKGFKGPALIIVGEVVNHRVDVFTTCSLETNLNAAKPLNC